MSPTGSSASTRTTCNRRAHAIQHYAELTALLAAQVGVPPAAETTALYQRLLAGR
jgi:DNA-binding SARP family transcriptional activator